ncbi:MAG: hypothetical protein IKW45_07805, partial [Clostridia bacterium]|nr:hypothetical protein [Clostridia bacterium]
SNSFITPHQSTSLTASPQGEALIRLLLEEKVPRNEADEVWHKHIDKLKFMKLFELLKNTWQQYNKCK